MLRLKLDRESVLLGAFITIIGYPFINIVVNSSITLVIGANTIDTALQLLITLFFVFFAIRGANGKVIVPTDCAIGAMILTAIIGSTAFFYPENYTYMKPVVGEIWAAFFAYYIIRLTADTQLMLKGLKFITYFAFVSGIFLALVLNGAMYIPGGEGVGYMVYGYKMLPSAVLAWYFYQKEKQKHMLAISIASVICILVFGSRGAFVSFLGFVALSYLFINKSMTWKKAVTLILAAVLAFVLTNETVMLFLSEIFTKWFGYTSRTLSLVLAGEAANDSGRDVLREMGYQVIQDNWFFGAGAFVDRTLVHPWLGTGMYIHNFFLEIIMDFGVPAAIFIFGWIFIPVFRAIKKYDAEDRELVIIFLSLWLFEHMFSGTFWTNPFFYATLALNYMLWVKYRDHRRV